MKREKHASYSSHDSCNSLSEEHSDYDIGRHSSHTKHQSQRREKERRPQEVNISEERKVPLTTLSFQGYALYWLTSLVRK